MNNDIFCYQILHVQAVRQMIQTLMDVKHIQVSKITIHQCSSHFPFQHASTTVLINIKNTDNEATPKIPVPQHELPLIAPFSKKKSSIAIQSKEISGRLKMFNLFYTIECSKKWKVRRKIQFLDQFCSFRRSKGKMLVYQNLPLIFLNLEFLNSIEFPTKLGP